MRPGYDQGGSTGLTGDDDEIENRAAAHATDGAGQEADSDGVSEFNKKPSNAEFLQMVAEADQQASFYSNQINRTSWERGYLALHQKHFSNSKYLDREFANRSKLFIPKTRGAVRKDLAAVAASLFGTIDAVNCMAGDEGDQMQRASAAVVQELVNYRTDRSNRKAAIPWFHTALGARYTSLVTGFCMSKQSWKLELKRSGTENFVDDDGEEKERDVWKPHIDRPDVQLIPPENVVIDPAADWTNPAQDAAYVLIKWPMRIDEIRRKQRDPRMPWKDLDEHVLRAAGEGAKMEAAGIRRAREQGLDRYDSSQTGMNFDIIWVWETFIRTAGEDWTFISIGNKDMLTDPAPVSEVYPEQGGERPLTFGYGSFEPFRIFPMAAVESWQMLQQEANDIRNLSLDAIKQNVMPVTKVVRGKNVDLDQLKRRGQGTAIMVQDPTDVTWEHVPDVPASVQAMKQQLDVEFDDLAGQQNYGTVQDNNALGKTLGGLKLAAGAANSVQELDIRIWIETWCEPVLAQVVRLEQYYESDPIILGLCGDRAKLMQKFNVDQITDELLENNVTIRVNIGLGAGDPQQRLAKFQSATQVALPLLQMDPDFKSGKKTIDSEAVMAEVYGSAGYKDGGKRFIKEGPPMPNAGADAATDKLKSEAEKNRAMAKKALLDALSGAAKVGIDVRAIALDEADADFNRHLAHVEQVGKAQEMGHQHGMAIGQAQQAAANQAKGLGPDGQPLVPPGGDGAAGAPAGGGAPVPGPTEPGAGNAGVAPAQLGDHGVPAGDAGQQQVADAASQQANLEKAVKPKHRTVAITKRGPDGRASEFHIQEH
jgi:hypothetical protein